MAQFTPLPSGSDGSGRGLLFKGQYDMMVVTKTPTKQRQSAVFVCRKTTAYLRTGTKPGTVEVSHKRCDSALDDTLGRHSTVPGFVHW